MPPTRGISGPPWRFSDLLLAAGISLAALTAMTQAFMSQLTAGPWSQMVLGVCLEAASVLPAVYLVARRRGVRRLDQMGLGPYPWKKAVLLGGAGGLVLFLLIQVCGIILAFLGAGRSRPGMPAELLDPRNLRQFAAFLFAAVVAAPVWEEIFFRGLTYQVFRRSLGAAAGAVLSGALFALAHAEPLVLRAPIFLLGVILAVYYEKTGTLYVPIAAHAAANLLSILLASLGGNG